jgi:hypothetical protein
LVDSTFPSPPPPTLQVPGEHYIGGEDWVFVGIVVQDARGGGCDERVESGEDIAAFLRWEALEVFDQEGSGTSKDTIDGKGKTG